MTRDELLATPAGVILSVALLVGCGTQLAAVWTSGVEVPVLLSLLAVALVKIVRLAVTPGSGTLPGAVILFALVHIGLVGPGLQAAGRYTPGMATLALVLPLVMVTASATLLGRYATR